MMVDAAVCLFVELMPNFVVLCQLEKIGFTIIHGSGRPTKNQAGKAWELAIITSSGGFQGLHGTRAAFENIMRKRTTYTIRVLAYAHTESAYFSAP